MGLGGCRLGLSQRARARRRGRRWQSVVGLRSDSHAWSTAALTTSAIATAAITAALTASLATSAIAAALAAAALATASLATSTITSACACLSVWRLRECLVCVCECV